MIGRRSPIKKKGKNKSKKVVSNKRNQEFIFFHRLINNIYGPEDLESLSDEFVALYLPIFLQMPTLIDVLHDKITKSAQLKQLAYWCVRSELKMANIYLNNKTFLGDTTDLDNTYEFFKVLAAKFPLTKGQKFASLSLCDPVYFRGKVKEIEVTKVFLSGHNPCLLTLTYEDSAIPPSKIMFKDDDIRSDMMVCTIFNVFNSMWQGSALQSEPQLITFKVVPAGPGFGFMECVENSCSVHDYDFTNISKYSDEEMETFLKTAAGGYIGGFLLGIRDRHEDNLMIKDNHKFFQLDFKHAFNVKTFGIDGCRFAISHRLKNEMVAKGKWINFKERVMAAYMVLRRNSQIILHLCRYLFAELFTNQQIETEMLRGFYLDRTEENALIRIDELIESGVVSVKRVMKNLTHILSGNIKPKKAIQN